jgi:hypothetical protein
MDRLCKHTRQTAPKPGRMARRAHIAGDALPPDTQAIGSPAKAAD